MKLRLLTVGLALAMITSAAMAATLTMTATPTARFDDSFNSLPLNGTNDPGIYQIDLAFSISGLSASEKGWGGMGFDVNKHGLSLVSGVDYGPDVTTVDS